MNIAVLIKMVPDTESKLEVNDGILNDQSFKYMVNPYDEFAVEQAVQFKEAEGGKVTLLSLFSDDNSIDTDLRKMLAIGADEIVVLRQQGYRGDKPLANAKALSDAIKELDVDLVLCGIQGIDYYQAATGTMVAQMLEMQNIKKGVIVIIKDNRGIFEWNKDKKENDTIESQEFREYGVGAQILRDIGVRKMVLLTNSKKAIIGLQGFDLKIVGHKELRYE